MPPLHEGTPVEPWFRAIAADGELVGFIMVAEPLPTQPHPYLWRLMVDWRHQGRGIGRAAIATLAAAGRHGEARRHFRTYCARMDDIGVESAPFPAAGIDRSRQRAVHVPARAGIRGEL